VTKHTLPTPTATSAVVTGAAQGIGKAIAQRLAADGYRVICVDTQAELLTQVAADIDGEAVVLDVTDEIAIRQLRSIAGDCGVLVNNAAIQIYEDLLHTTVEHMNAIMAVNVIAPVLLAQTLVPVMHERGGGSIIHLSSITAQAHSPGVSLYPASKAAIEHLTQGMAVEFGPLGIRCNAVSPGTVETEGTASHYGDDAARSAIAGVLPLGRMGRVEDIADAVAWLVSPEAAWVTGQILSVDGGYLASTGSFFRRARKSIR
jgi:NAD(P)-dependent dehydrogenase (short-subunit alcohol dehydrogenase family)